MNCPVLWRGFNGVSIENSPDRPCCGYLILWMFKYCRIWNVNHNDHLVQLRDTNSRISSKVAVPPTTLHIVAAIHGCEYQPVRICICKISVQDSRTLQAGFQHWVQLFSSSFKGNFHTTCLTSPCATTGAWSTFAAMGFSFWLPIAISSTSNYSEYTTLPNSHGRAFLLRYHLNAALANGMFHDSMSKTTVHSSAGTTACMPIGDAVHEMRSMGQALRG